MSIGIFGGSFDPPHIGHTAALKAFVKTHDFSRVFVVPAFSSPKKEQSLCDAEERLELARIAFSRIPSVEISSCETERQGTSFTVDTVDFFRQRFPGERVYLYLGSDMLMSLETWHKADELMKKASFCAFSRTGEDFPILLKKAEELNEKYGASIEVYQTKPIEASSTEVRASLALGVNSPFLQLEIAEVIRSEGLYSDPGLGAVERLMRSRLSEKRLNHCLGVAETAVKLAEKYGADEKKAGIAGLLHDITKNLSGDEQIAYARKNGIPLDSAELSAPQIIHAKTAEHYLRKTLGITDREILSAVRYHTTGHEGISLLEKIIYVADFIEPNRDYSDVSYYRHLADLSIDDALYAGMKWIIADKLSSDGIVHPDTIHMYNQYVSDKKMRSENHD